MKSIGIFYGSTTGTTETVAQEIAKKLSVDVSNVLDISRYSDDMLTKYDVLLLGSSTWGAGELQDDWYAGIEKLKKADLSGKTVAIFGCGDSYSYSDTFCDAVGEIYKELKDSGCTFCGFCENEGYEFEDSQALIDGKLVGLLIDEDNEGEKTSERIQKWVEGLKNNCLN